MLVPESVKLDIISQITQLSDAEILMQLADVLDKNTKKKEHILAVISKLIRKKLDIEQLKTEQNFTNFNRARFNQLIKKLDIKEPIEVLLQSI